MDGSWLKLIVYGWDYDKYWNIRQQIYNPRMGKFKKKIYSAILRWTNRRNSADINFGYTEEDNFKSFPILPHGIRGIVIASEAKIGRNCYIEHQVTIGRSGGCPTIGDNVFIGPGAKVFGNIIVGNNVRIGANAVVFENIPDNATVVLQKPRVLIKSSDYHYDPQHNESAS